MMKKYKRDRILNKWLVLFCALLLTVICVSSLSEAVPVLSLNESSITLVKGKTAKLTPSVSNVENVKKLKYTWESSNTAVATVSNGTVKAVDGGVAVITCSTVLEDGTVIQSAADVTVTVPVTSLKLASDKQLTIKSGSTSKVRVEIAPPNATDKSLTWESSDSSVAAVDMDGVITAKSAGKATVTAVTKDGSKKKIQVSVYVPSLYSSVTSVNLNSLEGKSVDVSYYGKNWNNDISIVQKGNAFTYSISGGGNKYTVTFNAVSAGDGSLTISDKKDSKSKLQFNVTVSSGAIQANQYVLLTKCTCNKGNVNFAFKNNSGNDIAEIRFMVLPYNRFNEIVYFNTSPKEGELRWYNYDNTLNAGKSSSFRGWVGKDYIDTSVDHIDIAVDYLRFTNGKIVTINSTDLYFYSSQSNTYKYRANKKGVVNGYPDKSTLDKADGFKLGYTSSFVYSWDAKHYGYRHGGQYVSEIVPDSMAEKAGLKTKDMIVSVNGIDLSEDEYALEKAKAEMADTGKDIVMVVERYAQEGTITLILKK